ncbi:alpha/beta fold hydrolase [Kitasatospora sp. NPDC057015]|uniref:alpha/beta fold hydrolase n=1 Tax=Kitasatospora sp. NPDC057015 TaxID=3346001 RepID=UPI00362C42E5
MPHFTSYDGTRLWYDEFGAGPLLLALAGGPGMDARYLGSLGGLDAGRTVVRLHGRASGRSDTPAERASCSFAEQGRDVEALRRHLGLDRVDLLAHSAGALVAQRYAYLSPERVGRLLLVTPVGRAAREPDEAELAAIRAGRSAEPWYPEAAVAERRLADGADPTPELLAALTPFHWGDWTEDARREAGRPLTPPQPWLRQAFYAGAGTPAPLPGTEILVIAGALDGLIGTAPARLVADCHPLARLEVLAEAGHRPWIDVPDRFADLAGEFLDA